MWFAAVLMCSADSSAVGSKVNVAIPSLIEAGRGTSKMRSNPTVNADARIRRVQSKGVRARAGYRERWPKYVRVIPTESRKENDT